MTKQAFLAELSTLLAGMDENLRTEICGEFADHFTEGAARGMSEEDICRNLGQPADIADQFKSDYANAVSQGSPYPTPPIPPVPPTPPVPPVPPIPEIDIPPINLQPVAAQLSKLAEDVVQSVQQTVNYFGGGSNACDIDINKAFRDIDHIRVGLKNSNLFIRPTENSDAVNVQLKGRARHDRFIVEQYGNELHIIENAIQYPFDFIFSQKVQLDTTIWLPASFGGTLSIQVSTGETIVTNVCGEKLDLKNSTKNTQVSGCRFRSFDIQASAGNLHFADCTAEYIKLHASASGIRVENSSGALDAHSSAGSLTVVRHRGAYIKVSSSANDVRIKDCDAKIDAHSTAGNVIIKCENKTLPAVNAHSSAGELKLEAGAVGKLDVTATAGNAKIIVGRLDGDTNIKSSAGNVLLEAHAVNGNIDAKASTGNVIIRLPQDADCRIETSAKMGSVRKNIRGNEQSAYILRAKASIGDVRLEAIEA